MTNSSTNQPYLAVRDLIELLQKTPQDAKVFAVNVPNSVPVTPRLPVFSLKLTNEPIGNVLTIIGE